MQPVVTPLESNLDFCLGEIIDLLGVERSSLMYFNKQKNEMRVCAAKGYKVYPIAGLAIRWGRGAAGLALKEDKAIAISEIKESARLTPSNGFFEASLKSLLCVPVIGSKEPLGVINISTISFHKRFDEADVDTACRIAQRVAVLMKHFPG